jgi:TfoX/Sxy family transcriptional regulator of competence genes
MSSHPEYLHFVLSQLSDLEGVTYRPMMGEYLLYYQGKLFGGIYDDRLLVKPTKSARALLPEASFALPYEGAKQMLLVEELDDPIFLASLIPAIAKDLPEKR